MRYITGYVFLLMLLAGSSSYAQSNVTISTAHFSFIVKAEAYNDSTHTIVATLEIYSKPYNKLLQQTRIDHLLLGHKQFHHLAISNEVDYNFDENNDLVITIYYDAENEEKAVFAFLFDKKINQFKEHTGLSAFFRSLTDSGTSLFVLNSDKKVIRVFEKQSKGYRKFSDFRFAGNKLVKVNTTIKKRGN